MTDADSIGLYAEELTFLDEEKQLECFLIAPFVRKRTRHKFLRAATSAVIPLYTGNGTAGAPFELTLYKLMSKVSERGGGRGSIISAHRRSEILFVRGRMDGREEKNT